MSSIKVSIVIISYNQGDFIEETISSVLGQTYSNVEFLLIDGGSTDNTMNVVRKYEDKFSIVIHEKDNGQTDAINKGFKRATGELVGWVNSDDILYPNCVEEIVRIYNMNKDGAIYCLRSVDAIDVNSKKIQEFVYDIPDRNSLLRNSYEVNQQGSFYSAKVLERVQYLNEKLNYCMDLDLWLRLLKHGPIYQSRERSLAAFRIGNYTKTSTGGATFLREIRKTLLRHGASTFDRSVLKTFWSQLKMLIKLMLTR